jgi:hypothetical protein
MADNATPAGSSLAAELLLLVAEYFGDADARRRADLVLAQATELVPRMPVMLGHLLGAADTAVYGAIQVAIVGEPEAPDTRALRAAVSAQYVPSPVLAGGAGEAVRGLPLFDARGTTGGRATAYVCRGYACELPTTDPDVLRDQLGRATRSS